MIKRNEISLVQLETIINSLKIRIPNKFKGLIFAPSSEIELAFLLGCLTKGNIQELPIGTIAASEFKLPKTKKVDYIGKFNQNHQLCTPVELKIKSSNLFSDFQRKKGYRKQIKLCICWVDDYTKVIGKKPDFETIELKSIVSEIRRKYVLEPSFDSKTAPLIKEWLENSKPMFREIIGWIRKTPNLRVSAAFGGSLTISTPKGIVATLNKTNGTINRKRKVWLTDFSITLTQWNKYNRLIKECEKKPTRQNGKNIVSILQKVIE